MINRYSEDQRARIGEKLLDFGNIAAGALLFGQFVSSRSLDFELAVIGIIVIVNIYLIGLRVMREDD